jgi:hypothetical protein
MKIGYRAIKNYGDFCCEILFRIGESRQTVVNVQIWNLNAFSSVIPEVSHIEGVSDRQTWRS